MSHFNIKKMTTVPTQIEKERKGFHLSHSPLQARSLSLSLSLSLSPLLVFVETLIF